MDVVVAVSPVTRSSSQEYDRPNIADPVIPPTSLLDFTSTSSSRLTRASRLQRTKRTEAQSTGSSGWGRGHPRDLVVVIV